MCSLWLVWDVPGLWVSDLGSTGSRCLDFVFVVGLGYCRFVCWLRVQSLELVAPSSVPLAKPLRRGGGRPEILWQLETAMLVLPQQSFAVFRNPRQAFSLASLSWIARNPTSESPSREAEDGEESFYMRKWPGLTANHDAAHVAAVEANAPAIAPALAVLLHTKSRHVLSVDGDLVV